MFAFSGKKLKIYLTRFKYYKIDMYKFIEQQLKNKSNSKFFFKNLFELYGIIKLDY